MTSIKCTCARTGKRRPGCLTCAPQPGCEALVIHYRLSRIGKFLSQNAKGPQGAACAGVFSEAVAHSADRRELGLRDQAHDGFRARRRPGALLFPTRERLEPQPNTRDNGRRTPVPWFRSNVEAGRGSFRQRIATICDPQAYPSISPDIFPLCCTSILMAAGMGLLFGSYGSR